MKEKANLLVIAPYAGLGRIFGEASKSCSGVNIDVIVSNLDDTVSALSNMNFKKYDALISRGGTAELLRKNYDVPLVEVEISTLDMLRVIQVARKSCKSFAVVGFSNIAKPAKTLQDILKYSFLVREIRSEQEASKALDELSQVGVTLVIGDVITTKLCNEASLDALLVTSGTESVLKAIDAAIALSDLVRKLMLGSSLSSKLIELSPHGIAAFDSSWNCRLSNSAFKSLSNAYALVNFIKLRSSLKGTVSEHSHLADDIIHVPCDLPSENFHAIFADTGSEGKDGILISTRTVRELIKPYCLLDAETLNAATALLSSAANGDSINIVGEPGTEKEELAEYLYLNMSNLKSSQHHFTSVDCTGLSERNWDLCTHRVSTIMIDSSGAICFSGIDSLSDAILGRLLHLIEECNTNRRISLFFISNIALENIALQRGLVTLHHVFLNCLRIRIRALHERTLSIPTICSMIIGSLNSEFGKQIIGFDKHALEVLKTMQWPLNDHQFQQVVNNACANSISSYISQDELERALTDCDLPITNEYVIDASQKLEYMEQQLILYVLEKHHMNQTTAAASLGISRSTLWRKLVKLTI